LVPKRDYLSLERTPRPEEVQEDPPEQIENLEHPAFIARFGRSGQADEICGRDSDYLSFERTSRPEEVQEYPPEQIENLEHPAFIARFGRSGQADGICGRDSGQVHTNIAPTAQKRIREDARLSQLRQVRRAA
jgi:hypothetical protein